MHTHSDGIHDMGQYSLHFSKYEDSIVLWDTSRTNEEGYEERWREECEEKSRAYEMY